MFYKMECLLYIAEKFKWITVKCVAGDLAAVKWCISVIINESIKACIWAVSDHFRDAAEQTVDVHWVD